MTAVDKPVVAYAAIHRLCCDYKYSGKPRGVTDNASWEMYLVIYNTNESWPTHRWPTAQRHQPPTITERTEALAQLGYAPAPDTEWEWTEGEDPACHSHPAGVSFLGKIDVIPLEQAQAADGGEG